MTSSATVTELTFDYVRGEYPTLYGVLLVGAPTSAAPWTYEATYSDYQRQALVWGAKVVGETTYQPTSVAVTFPAVNEAMGNITHIALSNLQAKNTGLLIVSAALTTPITVTVGKAIQWPTGYIRFGVK